jgi:hypothetical protein
VHLFASIVPFDGEPAISFSFFFERTRIIFLHHLKEVLGMFFSNVFYPKAINNKRKADWMPRMCPQPWCSSEVQSKVIFMGHQILSCHVPVVRSFFHLVKDVVINLKFSI